MQDEYQQIIDYLSDELSEEEKAAFETSLKENPEKQELFKQTAKNFHSIRWAETWDNLDEKEAYNRLQKRLHQRKLRIQFMKYAALFVCLLGVGYLFRTWQMQPTQLPLATNTESPATVGFPLLTLDNGIQLPLHTSGLSGEEVLKKNNIRLTDSGSLEYIPLSQPTKEKIAYNTLTIPHGCEFSVVLSDGSRIWLNAGSELKYPEVFSGDTREIFLNGEAYFEITSDTARPFYVRTQDMQLKVLGTCFNIKAYSDETEIVTTLISGSIEQHFSSIGQKLRLVPLQQSHFDYNTRKLQIHKADPEEVLAWKNGKFIARDKTLEEILRELARWYDFEAVYTHSSLRLERFHLHTNRYNTIREILDNLQSTNGIRFSYNENKIYISQ